LLAGLYLASAMMTRPEHPVYASKFDSDKLLNPSKPTPTPVLTAEAAPEPPHIAEVAAEPDAAPAPAAALAPAKQQTAEVKTKKKPRVHHRRHQPEYEPDSWNAFAYAPQQRWQRRANRDDFWFR